MNVLEGLAKSAENNHGRTLEARQVRELVTIMQAMQMEIGAQQMRADGATRVAAIALNQLGGRLQVVPEMYMEAEHYAVEVSWNEEGDVIDVTLTKDTPAGVDVPGVSEDSGSDDGDTVSAVRLPESEGGREGDADEADLDETDDE